MRGNKESKAKSAIIGLMRRLASNYEFLCKRFGQDEGLRLVEQMSSEYALSVIDRVRRRLEGKDAGSLGRYFLYLFENMGSDFELADMQPERVVIRMVKCPLGFTDSKICEAHLAFERTIVAKLGDSLVHRVGRSIPEGDSYCEHIIEKTQK